MIEALVVGVIDGDSVKVLARPWPQVIIETSIRVLGIDTPESGHRAGCDHERDLARQATGHAHILLAGKTVGLVGVEPDKFGGRFIARIILPDGRDFAQVMLEAGLARPYQGERRQPWC